MAELHIHSMERCYLECVISIDMHIVFVRSIISESSVIRWNEQTNE